MERKECLQEKGKAAGKLKPALHWVKNTELMQKSPLKVISELDMFAAQK